ncbi:uncharacterized protein Z518_07688 [Rhinocladiella mackenziei CBS 650.93]|uniref:Uncharacterized protein n=1 Tax=Rhinocladiella mackenziei CBS 650.93 TaxID=1442369 RepID=A0A0D2J557_9EURO|nr:uncharacterized protein Z518_07688 [Rhinocladiella mackenziei CBS 650.93]KIX04135.1 hypothetical protein Z518_07688 [Rhinocladiella mackenziei CBS 650.93]
MTSQFVSRESFILPKLKFKFRSAIEVDRFAFYDVKFYPYSRPEDDEPVFAVVGQKKVLIGRLSAQSSAVVTMIHELVDAQEARDPNSPGLNSCSWCYIDQERPLLAVAGGSGQLKILDALEGDLFNTLTGHGHGTINDIATHPFMPWIVATASMDKSLRIWDLRRHANRYESPTIIICGQATGHTEGVLTVSWHPSGRYLVTGGHDQRICVWTIPDLSEDSTFWRDISPRYRKRSSNDVLTIYFPHFTSASVHSNFVDCARFFGDLIISKAANEDKIVLWRITGFDSEQPPPDSTTAPKLQDFLDTRNGFIRRATCTDRGITSVEVRPEYKEAPLYDRLLEFETSHTEQFYLRFGLLSPSPDFPDLHPVLAFANAKSELRFWDLERLTVGHAGGLAEGRTLLTARRKMRGIARPVKPSERLTRMSRTPSRLREMESPMSSTSNLSSGARPRQSSTEATPATDASTATETTSATEATSATLVAGEISDLGETSLLPFRDRERYPIHDPHAPLKPHSKVSLAELQFKNMAFFNARAVDWSPCGRWCIVAGESAINSVTRSEGIGAFAVLYR